MTTVRLLEMANKKINIKIKDLKINMHIYLLIRVFMYVCREIYEK